ncbi:MAG: hypothetical protein DME25_08785 [Verrucomicrobia bacterium]|nr:MAG: hypothetical protein DME25_08785 [Verrucomicrobiota bacterium]
MKPHLLILLISCLFPSLLPAAQPATNDVPRLLQSAHALANRSTVGAKTITQRDAARTTLFNNQILLRLAETNGLWDAAWLATSQTAILHAGFTLELNGKIVRLDSSSIEVRPFTNQLGSGLQARQISGDAQTHTRPNRKNC